MIETYFQYFREIVNHLSAHVLVVISGYHNGEGEKH